MRRSVPWILAAAVLGLSPAAEARTWSVPSDALSVGAALLLAGEGDRIEVDAAAYDGELSEFLTVRQSVQIVGVNGVPPIPSLDVQEGLDIELQDVALTGGFELLNLGFRAMCAACG